MKWTNIAIGTVGTIIVLFFLFFALRSCTRRTGSSFEAATAGLSPSDSLTACTPDPGSGLCYPQEKDWEEGFDNVAFMAMVREHQMSSSSSSSRGSLLSGGSLLARLHGGRSSSFSSASSARTSSGASVFLRQSSSAGSTGHTGSAGSGDNGSGNGSGTGGSGGSGGNGGGGDASRTASGSGSGITGYGGLQGSRGPLPSGKCLRSRSLLGIVDLGDATTGDAVTFPGLIDGDCPISAAILRGPDNGDGFGGPLNDF